MRVALIDGNPLKGASASRRGSGTSSTVAPYCVALLKLGAWLQDSGHECFLWESHEEPPEDCDEAWISTLFTFDIPHVFGLAKAAEAWAGQVVVGGISATLMPERFERAGLTVHKGLHPEAEAFAPDYSLLAQSPDTTITHTSRGCVRKCEFCAVHTIEPKFSARDWRADLAPGKTDLMFYDNNWLAKPIKKLAEDADAIRALVAEGRVGRIDFNQGMDCRLLTEKKADVIAGLPWEAIRFAFDGMHEDGHWQRAVRMMAARGGRDFRTYLLYNFTDTPEDFWYRIRENAVLAEELGVLMRGFPMRYQPIREIDKGHVGEHWSRRQRDGFPRLMGQFSGPSGFLTFGGPMWTPLEEFEFWFTDSAETFARMLSYPKLSQLSAQKAGVVRQRRQEFRAMQKSKAKSRA